MKRRIVSILFVLLFFFMIVNPQKVFSGAQNGLLLWFQILLPTLFPFMLITNLLIQTNGLDYITHVINPFICPLFQVTKSGSFAIITGYLCGYPLGAKIIADLYNHNEISKVEAQYLLSFCNNTSPVFILNYVVWKSFGRTSLSIPCLLLLLGTPMFMSLVFRKHYKIESLDLKDDNISTKQRSNWGIQIFDQCIMNGFESMIKIGGYVILFSIIFELCMSMSVFQSFGGKILLSSLEITNGIQLLTTSADLPARLIFPAVLGITSFGGFCSIAQTQCMLRDTPLKITRYIAEKLVTALATSLFAFIYICFA